MEIVSSDEWFRSAGWSNRDREIFEQKLAKAHRASRPQYLRLKALALLETHASDRRRAGASLLERLLAEYPDSRIEVAGAHCALARFREECGDVEQATAHYRETLRAEEGAKVVHGAELLLAELIVRHEQRDAYREADDLLDRVIHRGSIFRSEQFRYAVARSRLATRRGDHDEASAFALGALDLFEHNRPVSSYHPDVGLARADGATLAELEAVAEQGAPEKVSDLVDRYRGADGAVRWDWSLVSRIRHGKDDARLQAEDDFHSACEPIVDELRRAGFDVYDFDDWVRSKLPSAAAADKAAQLLIGWFDRTSSLRVKTAIATALTDSRARRPATGPLIERFRELKSPDLNGTGKPSEELGARRRLKDSLASALGTLARDDHFKDVAELIRDPGHGRYRAYLFWALPHMKHPGAVDLALEMLDDEEMHMSALRAVADLRSERGRAALEAIAGQPQPKGRGAEAQLARARIDVAVRGLQKLEKARATGKSRP